MQQLEIGIAGAGIGGLAAATALARDGHAVSLFDQFDTPRPVGSGLVIQPVGQAVLARIGADTLAHGHGQVVTHMLGHEARRGRVVLDVSYDPSGDPARCGLAIHRAALFHALFEAAQATGVEVITHSAVMGFRDGRLSFDDGRDSQRFDLVIDASGAGSPLSPLRARDLPYGAVWGTVDWPDNAPFPEHQLSQRYRAARNMVGVLPVGTLPGGGPRKAAIFWSLPREGIAGFQQKPLSEWKAAATALWPEFAPFLQGISDHGQLTPAFYGHGTLRRPVAPGLVHIGDAAHRASPQLGQGANMALLDAWALTLALRDSPTLDAALNLYCDRRKRHLWIYQLMSAVFTPMYQSNSRILPLIRDHVLAPLSGVPPGPRLLSRIVCGDLIAPLHGCDI